MSMNTWLIGFPLLAAGVAAGYVLRHWMALRERRLADTGAEAILEKARREAESIVREGKLQATDERLRARDEIEADVRARREEVDAAVDRLTQREALFDRKLEAAAAKEAAIEKRLGEIEEQRAVLAEGVRLADILNRRMQQRLLEVTGLSREAATGELMKSLEADLQHESAALIRRARQEAHETAEREARKIIALAIERFAAEQVNEMTTFAVPLPSEDMKGRIIGKEGRNIRAIEAATGVNILIDETPEVVVISSFDPLRREIARQSMERLIADGRIHPSRIEEIVHKVQAEIDEIIRATGEQAAYELQLPNFAPEVADMLGRLKYRHSYGQNVLKHSIEMGHLMGMMASELGLDPAIARRVGLLHDIGKAMDHAIEGSHALIGADFLRKHGETPLVVNAVAAHHGEVEAESLYAVLARAGDAMTAARPGARSEHTEIYLKRLEKLEQIAGSYRGVERCFAVQAGREVRVIVEPKSISDDEALILARNISRQIEQDVTYPGQIKVTVVRETRCVEYAK